MKRVLLLILTATLVSGVSYAGWQKWQSNQAAKKTNTNQQSQSNDPSEGGKYLVIKEWNVRVLFSITGYSDTKYNFSDENLLYFHKNGLEDEIAKLNLDEKAAFTECVRYPVANIARILTSNIEADSENTPFYLREPLKKVGIYSYYISPPQSACPKLEAYPRVDELLKTYVLEPYSNKRINLIEALEEVKN